VTYGSYGFSYRFPDSYSLAASDLDVSSMAAETSAAVHTLQGGLGVDTVDAFQRGRFPAPAYGKVIVSKSVSNRETRAPLMLVFQLGMFM